MVLAHPDRPNIMYFKQERSPGNKQHDDLDAFLNDIVKGLREQKLDYPITIMYCELEIVQYVYRYLEEGLKNQQYIGEVGTPENRIFAMYHQAYTDRMKAHITTELAKEKSTVRFVAATVALGMGLDARHIRRVIHFKSPTSIERYLQETGRAGRDGQAAEAILYYNKTDLRLNRPGQQAAMVNFCKTHDKCLRQMLMKHLDFSVPEDRLLCRCCQYCKPKCHCDKCFSALTSKLGM